MRVYTHSKATFKKSLRRMTHGYTKTTNPNQIKMTSGVIEHYDNLDALVEMMHFRSRSERKRLMKSIKTGYIILKFN
jgi:stalled ribosome alternative rescue factor ArfA